MLDFRSADAIGERAERAVGRGMAVAAHQRHARQRKTLLRADDVDDALTLIELVVVFEIEEFRVFGQIRDLGRAFRIGIGQMAVGGRHVVIDHEEGLIRRVHLAAGQPQAFERLWARHFMHDMTIDIDQSGAIRRLLDQMIIPDFVVQRAGFGHHETPVRLGRTTTTRRGGFFYYFAALSPSVAAAVWSWRSMMRADLPRNPRR